MTAPQTVADVQTRTPGIWRAEKWSEREAQVVASYGGKKSLICAGVMNADAALIAAAPKLVDALEDVLSEALALGMPEECNTVCLARAALRAAATSARQGETK